MPCDDIRIYCDTIVDRCHASIMVRIIEYCIFTLQGENSFVSLACTMSDCDSCWCTSFHRHHEQHYHHYLHRSPCNVFPPIPGPFASIVAQRSRCLLDVLLPRYQRGSTPFSIVV